MDKFYSQTNCDRCGAILGDSRTMSRFSKECICRTCAAEERKRSDYDKAVQADLAEIKKGNREFDGIGL